MRTKSGPNLIGLPSVTKLHLMRLASGTCNADQREPQKKVSVLGNKKH